MTLLFLNKKTPGYWLIENFDDEYRTDFLFIQASYGVENAEFAVTQLAQTTMRSEIGKITLDTLFRERESLNAGIVGEFVELKFLRSTIVRFIFKRQLTKLQKLGVSIVFGIWMKRITLFVQRKVIFRFVIKN